jgi:hypothetical protein
MGFCFNKTSKNRVAQGFGYNEAGAGPGGAAAGHAQGGFDPNTDPTLADAQHWDFCKNVDKSHFKLNKVIGVGSHGVIWLVDRRAAVHRTGERNGHLAMVKDKDGNTRRDQYAMKIQSKQRLFMLRSIESVKMEMNILS